MLLFKRCFFKTVLKVFVSNRFQSVGDIVPDSATRIKMTGFEKIFGRKKDAITDTSIRGELIDSITRYR